MIPQCRNRPVGQVDYVRDDRIMMKAGARLIRDRARYCIATVRPENGNIYRQAAKRVENALNADLDTYDTTRSQIISVIGDGYLSDGEYV